MYVKRSLLQSSWDLWLKLLRITRILDSLTVSWNGWWPGVTRFSTFLCSTLVLPPLLLGLCRRPEKLADAQQQLQQQTEGEQQRSGRGRGVREEEEEGEGGGGGHKPSRLRQTVPSSSGWPGPGWRERPAALPRRHRPTCTHTHSGQNELRIKLEEGNSECAGQHGYSVRELIFKQHFQGRAKQ